MKRQFQESDSQFRYLALELCLASLYDWVTMSAVKERCVGVTGQELLKQASDGLAHLHSINIGLFQSLEILLQCTET